MAAAELSAELATLTAQLAAVRAERDALLYLQSMEKIPLTDLASASPNAESASAHEADGLESQTRATPSSRLMNEMLAKSEASNSKLQAQVTMLEASLDLAAGTAQLLLEEQYDLAVGKDNKKRRQELRHDICQLRGTLSKCGRSADPPHRDPYSQLTVPANMAEALTMNQSAALEADTLRAAVEAAAERQRVSEQLVADLKAADQDKSDEIDEMQLEIERLMRVLELNHELSVTMAEELDAAQQVIAQRHPDQSSPHSASSSMPHSPDDTTTARQAQKKLTPKQERARARARARSIGKNPRSPGSPDELTKVFHENSPPPEGLTRSRTRSDSSIGDAELTTEMENETLRAENKELLARVSMVEQALNSLAASCTGPPSPSKQRSKTAL